MNSLSRSLHKSLFFALLFGAFIATSPCFGDDPVASLSGANLLDIRCDVSYDLVRQNKVDKITSHALKNFKPTIKNGRLYLFKTDTDDSGYLNFRIESAGPLPTPATFEGADKNLFNIEINVSTFKDKAKRIHSSALFYEGEPYVLSVPVYFYISDDVQITAISMKCSLVTTTRSFGYSE